MPERLWSHGEVAAFLHIPPSTLYELNSKGLGPPSCKIGKHRRYSPTAVWRWVADRTDVER